MSRFLRHPRRLRAVVLAAVALAGLAIPPAALGATRERSEYSLQFDGDLDCGTFHDVFKDYYDVRETDVFDADGNLTAVIYNAAHTWDDRNSVTGLVLHEHGHFTEVDDLIAETITITGVSEVMNVPGRGVCRTRPRRILVRRRSPVLRGWSQAQRDPDR